MCFVANNKKQKIAKSPIICYKFMSVQTTGNKFYLASSVFPQYSPYLGYELNEVYRAKYRGLGLWSNHDLPELVLEKMGTDVVIYSGFHSYRTLSLLRKEYPNDGLQYRAVKCEIPEGTPYFKNDTEFVSLNIKFIDIVW